jgi:hypothetical protein
MVLLTPIFVDVFAAHVSNRLIDLGVDVVKMKHVESSLRQLLFEVERDKRSKLNVYEAATYFFCSVFPNMPPRFYRRSISKSVMGKQAWRVISQWHAEGKIGMKVIEALQA